MDREKRVKNFFQNYRILYLLMMIIGIVILLSNVGLYVCSTIWKSRTYQMDAPLLNFLFSNSHIIIIFGMIGLILIAFSVFRIYSLKKDVITALEYEKLEYKDIDLIKEKAKKYIPDDNELIHKPIIVVYSSKFNDSIPFLKVSFEGKTYYSASAYESIYFTKDLVVLYEAKVNHIDGNISYEKYEEMKYENIISLQIETKAIQTGKALHDQMIVTFKTKTQGDIIFKIRDKALSNLNLGVREISKEELDVINSLKEVFKEKVFEC